MTGTLTTGSVEQNQLGVTAHHDRQIAAVHNHIPVFDLDGTVNGTLDRILLRTTLCRTTDVEGTHGQLGTGLTD